MSAIADALERFVYDTPARAWLTEAREELEAIAALLELMPALERRLAALEALEARVHSRRVPA